MTAQITEVLMGLGSFDFDFKHDADLADAPDEYDHVVVYAGEERIYTGVVLRDKSTRGASVGGCGIDWWLGKDDDGPVITDREYIAGTDKLSNGDLGDGDLLWRGDEDPMWVIAAGVASVVGTPTGDEVLQSDESFECEPGQLLGLACEIQRTIGAVGRLRLRVIYSGRFRWPNVLAASEWTDRSDYLTDADVSEDGTTLILGPVTQRQSIINSSFEDGLTHWYDEDGPAYSVVASLDVGMYESGHAVKLAAFGAGGRALLYDDDAAATPPVDPISVVPGERIFLQIAVTPWAEDSGFPNHADGRVYAGVLLLDVADANPVFFATDELGVDDVGMVAWTLTSKEFTVPEGRVRAHPFIQGYDVTTGAWAFDAFSLTHQEQNLAQLESDPFTVLPGRTYRLLVPVTSDAGVTGDIKATITFSHPDRDDVVVESSTMGPTGGVEKLFTSDFDVPSGYTTGQLRIVGVDVAAGSFRVRKSGISLQDSDTSTRPAGVVSPAAAAAWAPLTFNDTVPDGAERVHLEIVAEDQAQGWEVRSISLRRRETPDAAANVVAELLTDPDTSAQLVSAGNIHAAGTINYDWRLRNMTNRDALHHLSRSGLVAPLHEWRATADGSIDWGTPEEIFVDRDDVVLRETDVVVRTAPTLETDVVDRPTRIRTIGAERASLSGVKRLITGEASIDPAPAKDWFGNPLRRTRIIEDSTIETSSHAAGKAAIELEDSTNPAQAVELELADPSTIGAFDVGDWIYPYLPAAGVVDDDNPVEIEGETVWPAKRRVQSRTRKLGPGHQLFVRTSDGAMRDVTDLVDWEAATVATVQLGDLLPEFVDDPQGGEAGRQFRRYRASTGR